jgi:hypothetical protein
MDDIEKLEIWLSLEKILTPIQLKVVRLRFYENLTVNETIKKSNLTSKRQYYKIIKSIDKPALKKLLADSLLYRRNYV